MVHDKPTVFVIDDDAPVRIALVRLLRAAGYDAQGLDAPAAYLQHSAPRPPACLVLDVRMPGMSGLELHEKVRGTSHALPTVFITGHGDAEERRRALALGAVAVLDKPIGKVVLFEAIESALAVGRGDP
jgi:two-component system response regulator FixJ